MPLDEIEFELSAEQYAAMGYPGLRQGQPLTVLLDGGLLLPEAGALTWYSVQKEPLPARFGAHRAGAICLLRSNSRRAA